MRSAKTDLPEDYVEFARFERHENATNRRISYFLHFAAVVFFVPLFAGVTAAVRPGTTLDPVNLWSVGLPGIGTLGTLVILFLLVVAALYLRALLRAAAIRLAAGTAPALSLRGVMLRVTAESCYFSKGALVVLSVTPFFTIAVIGTVVLPFVPAAGLAWVYIPLVVNGVAVSRDVMTLSWVLVTPKQSLLEDKGEVLTVYAPPGSGRRPSEESSE